MLLKHTTGLSVTSLLMVLNLLSPSPSTAVSPPLPPPLPDSLPCLPPPLTPSPPDSLPDLQSLLTYVVFAQQGVL